ncbi:putative carboxypeptidase X1 [Platysternon megacephalum]|uniref:Putative carboxypeptidase X1 n=1 Tax=Platysternon megacephalum TaxID=55544 RepID=A0A4D9DLK3_9SAUR|nr:putative carboxypeptidase X1 [Platysternon megacephalum]
MVSPVALVSGDEDRPLPWLLAWGANTVMVPEQGTGSPDAPELPPHWLSLPQPWPASAEQIAERGMAAPGADSPCSAHAQGIPPGTPHGASLGLQALHAAGDCTEGQAPAESDATGRRLRP